METAGPFAMRKRGTFRETEGSAPHQVHRVREDERLQEDTGPVGEGFELQHRARKE